MQGQNARAMALGKSDILSLPKQRQKPKGQFKFILVPKKVLRSFCTQIQVFFISQGHLGGPRS